MFIKELEDFSDIQLGNVFRARLGMFICKKYLTTFLHYLEEAFIRNWKRKASKKQCRMLLFSQYDRNYLAVNFIKILSPFMMIGFIGAGVFLHRSFCFMNTYLSDRL
ncbi:hypothetical protein F0919_00465 [Taibaiella lutea]|uniref:Uncharacterized protein n=1 Tax=Taibaiella lutea TaxID=2608001 RepID=A0A5M6CME8_9BACT|nr:hypothetical protein [Taibaiella lutea]KAA5536177.1 hypothetical protein F0919_00465 [Taibaiella lutea]